MKRGPMPRAGSSRTAKASAAALAKVSPALFERADGRCEKCGDHLNAGAAHRHHRVRRHGPAGDVLSNLLLLHPLCHLASSPDGVHARPADSTINGWIVPMWMGPPCFIPVLYQGRWVYLTDDGAIRVTQPEGT